MLFRLTNGRMDRNSCSSRPFKGILENELFNKTQTGGMTLITVSGESTLRVREVRKIV